jgi:hypothetical protein
VRELAESLSVCLFERSAYKQEQVICVGQSMACRLWTRRFVFMYMTAHY